MGLCAFYFLCFFFEIIQDLNFFLRNKFSMSITTIKPVIYYNSRFHFVEEDCASKFHFDTEYAIFQIYNLKVGYNTNFFLNTNLKKNFF